MGNRHHRAVAQHITRGVGFFEYVTLSVTGVGTHTTTAHIVTIIHWDREEGGGRGEH